MQLYITGATEHKRQHAQSTLQMTFSYAFAASQALQLNCWHVVVALDLVLPWYK